MATHDEEDLPQEASSPDGQPAERDSLNVIRRQLYARKEPGTLRERADALRRLGIRRRERDDLEDTTDTLATTKYKNLALQRARRTGRLLRFSGIMVVGIFVLVWAVAVTVWYRSTLRVSEDQVNVTIEAPGEFTAGEEIIYRVRYANDSRVDWQNVDVVFTPPRGFDFRGSNMELARVGKQYVLHRDGLVSGEAGEIHVRGQLIGELNETAVVQVETYLTPENFPSGRFRSERRWATTITALPLEVNLSIPQDVADGERAVGQISLRNLSSHELSGVYLKVKAPPNVELAVGDADFSGGFSTIGSEWLIPVVASLASEDFSFVFFVQGQAGEQRVIDIEAGIRQEGEEFVQRAVKHVVKVSATEVEIEQLYNGSPGPLVVKAGEVITVQLKYRNVGTVGLKDVIVEQAFKGVGFSPGTLRLQSGAYDPVARQLSWSAATVPELAVLQPQQEGVIEYTFEVLATDQFPITGEGAQNNLLVSTVTVDSPDLPAPVGQPRRVVQDRAVISVGTDLILDVAAFYDDGRLGLTSTGPLPPRVGETTVYTVRFRIGSTLNDIGSVRLVSVLPDGVVHTGETFLTGGEVAFNERTGELTWSFPLVEGLTGRAKPSQELHFQVAITPGEDKRGEQVFLLRQLRLEATDLFTDQAVQEAVNVFPTTLTAVGNRTSEGVVE